MSFDAQMPLWFAVYPEFDVGVAGDCVWGIESFRSVVVSFRNQILDIENLLRCDGEGAWLEEYSRQAKRVWYWLGDVSVKLSQLAGGMEEVVSEAYRASYRKEQAWADIQRYVRPVGESVVPVSAGVALRDYVRFRTREYPLQIPFLPSPLTLGCAVGGAAGGFASVFSHHDTVGVDTDALRTASNIWYEMGKRYRRVLSVFEDATRAWVHGCGTFAPANFTPLLESLRGFPRIADQNAENLAETARRFDQTQEEMLTSFNWTMSSPARLASIRTDSYIDPWGHGSEHRDRPILEAFFRGLKQGAKDTVSTVGGLLGVISPDGIQPSILNNPEKELEDAFFAFIDDPLGALQAAWDSIAQSFQTPEGAAEFLGGIAGGAGVAGAAAKGIKIVSKGIKGIEKPRGRGEKERDTPPPPPSTLEANLKEVLKIDGAQFENGLLGVTDKAQIWKTNTPEQTAQEVAETLTKGYENKRMIKHNGTFKGWVYTMPDGSTVTYRPVSSGKRLNETYGQGSPAIDIAHTSKDSLIEDQKIHFKDIQ